MKMTCWQGRLGAYEAVQRLVHFGLMPLQAVLRLSYPAFFKAGARGIGASIAQGWSVFPLALAASGATAIGLMGAAQMLPLLIGPEFKESVSYLLYLAPLLPLFAVNGVLADTLSGAGFLSLRLALTALGVALQAAMFWLLHDGFRIVLASYAGLGLSCVLMAAAVFTLWRRERRRARLAEAPA
jgi:O-antigen/teichoic acid export membrane protein